jgi:hypothetical protein
VGATAFRVATAALCSAQKSLEDPAVTQQEEATEVRAHADAHAVRGAKQSDIALAVEVISAVHHVRGAAAYTILVEAAQNLRLTIGECASFIVNAKP